MVFDGVTVDAVNNDEHSEATMAASLVDTCSSIATQDQVSNVVAGTYSGRRLLQVDTIVVSFDITLAPDGSGDASTLVDSLSTELTDAATSGSFGDALISNAPIGSALKSATVNVGASVSAIETGTVVFTQSPTTATPTSATTVPSLGELVITSAGNYVQQVTVSIQMPAAPSATIWYTTNGRTPNAVNGTLYVGLLQFTATVQLKAIAVLAGHTDSPVVEVLYTVHNPQLDSMLPSVGPTSGMPVILNLRHIPSQSSMLDFAISFGSDAFNCFGAAAGNAQRCGVVTAIEKHGCICKSCAHYVTI
jgi:hypothetical protein